MKTPETILDLHGIVVGSVDVGERDKLLTVLTAERGLLTVYASGARRIKSRLLALSELFTYSRLLISERGDRLYLKDGDVSHNFYELRTSLERAALASYVCEVVSYTGTEQADPELLRLVLNTLYAVSEGLYPIPHIKAAFEFRYAAHLGFMPDVGGCAICGGGGETVLQIALGQVVCDGCRGTASLTEYEGEETAIALLSEGARAAIGYVVSAPVQKIFSFRLEGDDLRLFSGAAEEYLLYHTDHLYSTLTFYKQVVD